MRLLPCASTIAGVLFGVVQAGAAVILRPSEPRVFSLGGSTILLALDPAGGVPLVRGTLSNDQGDTVGFVVSLIPGQSYQVAVTNSRTLHLHWLELFRNGGDIIVINGDDEAWQ